MVINVRGQILGNHVHARVFMGPDGDHLALSGQLVFTIGEWQLFGAALLLGAERTQQQLIAILDDPLARQAELIE